MKAHGIDFEEIFIEPKENFEKQKKDKTVTEIISQKGKSNMEKFQEWIENEKLYNGLVDIKLDAGLGLQNKNLSGKTVEEIKEEYAGELLEISKAKED